MKKLSLKGRTVRLLIISIFILFSTGTMSYIILLLPPVQKYAIDLVERKLDSIIVGDLTIDKVRANIFSSIDLFGIKIIDKNGRDDSISIAHVKVRYNIAALFAKTISITRVRIDNVHTSLSVSPDTNYYIPALPKSVFNKKNRGKKIDPPPFPWKIHIGRVRIDNFNGVYKDSALNMRGEVSNAQISAKFNRIDSMVINLKVPQGRYTSPWWSGDVDTIGVNATIQWNGMDIIDSYVSGSGSVVKAKGHIAFLKNGHWDISADVKTEVSPVLAIQKYIPYLKSQGIISGTASWRGTIQKPTLSYSLSGTGFTFKSVHIDSLFSTGSYSDDLTARSNLRLFSSLGKISISTSLTMPDLMINPSFGVYQGDISIDKINLRKLSKDIKLSTDKIPGESGKLSIHFEGSGFDSLPQKVNASGYLKDHIFPNDSLHIGFQLSHNTWKIKSRLGVDSILGDGKIGLKGAFSGQVSGSINELAPLVDYFLRERVHGSIVFSATLDGCLTNPAVNANLYGRKLKWNSVSIDTVATQCRYDNKQISVQNLYTIGKANLKPISEIFKIDSISGMVEFTVEGYGKMRSFDLNSKLKLTDFTYRHYGADSISASVTFKNSDSIFWDNVSIFEQQTRIVSKGKYVISRPSGGTSLLFSKVIDKQSIPAGSISVSSSVEDGGLENTIQVHDFDPEVLQPWIAQLKGYSLRVSTNGTIKGELKNLNGILNTIVYKSDKKKSTVAALNSTFSLIDSSLSIDSDIYLHDTASLIHMDARLPLSLKNGYAIDTSSTRHAEVNVQGRIADIGDIVIIIGKEWEASGDGIINIKLRNEGNQWKIGGNVGIFHSTINNVSQKIRIDDCNLNSSISGTLFKPHFDYSFTTKTAVYAQSTIDSIHIEGRAGLDSLILNAMTLWVPGRGRFELSARTPLEKLDSILKKPGLEVEFALIRFPCNMISPFVSGYVIKDGTCRGQGRLRISNGRPVMIGRLAFKNCWISVDDVEPEIGPVDAEIIMAADSLRIDYLQGKWGKKGRLQGNGYAVWNNKGIGDLRIDFNLFNLSLVLPEIAEIMIQSANLHLSDKKDGYQLNGAVELGESKIIRDLRISDLLEQVQSRNVVAVHDDSFMQQLSLNIDVKLLEDLRVDMNLGKVQLDGGITIAGTAAKPTYTGEIHTTQGYILYLDRQFDISKGSFYNYNPYDLNPLIDLEASTEVLSISSNGSSGKNYTIKMSIKGDLQKPEVRLWEKSLPFDEADILSILTVGRPLGAIGGDLNERLRTFASSSLLDFGTRKLEQLLGMDRIDIEGDLLGLAMKKANYNNDSISSSPHLTLAKRITPRLLLSYETDLQDFAKMKVSALFRLTKRLFLEGKGGSEDYSLDLLFKFSR